MIHLAVTVEPNNAGFAIAGGTVTYTHEVVNTGPNSDSYELTPTSELGWQVELIDPTTGGVIAVDANGDGSWDGGGVNTGSLAPGESARYRLRVSVPGGTATDTLQSATLTAVSDRNPAVSDLATDETTVVDSLDLGPVELVPDHSGVVTSPGSIAYTHSITNNTGATDTFDLFTSDTLSGSGWTSTIYNDSNGDGVYTAGIDVAIANTLALADGQLQTVFVVVDAPLGVSPGDANVTAFSAFSRNDPTMFFDSTADTTTVVPAEDLDLSGGGTLLVDPGDSPVFPGTLRNLSADDDRYNLTLTPSIFADGEPGDDNLPHPTYLVIDTDSDGDPDLEIARDDDGDGVWDFVDPLYDLIDGNGLPGADGNPDVAVLAGGLLAYELQRPVDPSQLAYRDPITLSAESQNSGQVDSATPVNLLAAATHALIAGFDVLRYGSDRVVEWRTASEVGTVVFELYRAAGGEWRKLGPDLAALLHFPQGGTYRFLDTSTGSEDEAVYLLAEVDHRGRRSLHGPLRTSLEDSAELAAEAAAALVAAGGYSARPHTSLIRQAPPPATSPPPPAKAGGSPRVKLRSSADGLYFVDAADLAAALGESLATVQAWITGGGLRLLTASAAVDLCPQQPLGPGEIFSDGFESGDLCAWQPQDPAAVTVPWLPAAGASGLYYYAEAIDSIYTEDNVYWLEPGPGRHMTTRDGGAPPPAGGDVFVKNLHLEQEFYPMTAAIQDPDSDFWFWEFFFGGGGGKTFNLDVPSPASTGSAGLTVHFHGETQAADVDPDHHVAVRLNGTPIGDTYWDGGTAHQASFGFDPALLGDGANTVEIEAFLEPGVAFDLLYFEAFDLTYERLYRAAAGRLTAGADGHAVLSFEGFSGPQVEVFEITDPLNPRRLTNLHVDDLDGAYRFSFTSPDPAARFLALPLAGAGIPTIEADQPSSLSSAENRSEYLVIAADGLEAAAEELAALRRDSGLEAAAVRLEDVYDEFSGGVVSPWAIRDLLAWARDNWALAPRYVVLAGDSSFDYKDRLGAGEALLPAPMWRTPDGLFPSDHRLVDLDGDDGVPEIALGRLPALTGAELAAYVAKLAAWESSTGGWKRRTAWVADNIDKGGEFVGDSEVLIALLPPALDTERIYIDQLGEAAARAEVLDTFADGVLLVSYLGHGGLDRLADEGLLLTTDVPALGNQERAPVVTAFTCSVGRFDFPGFDTLAETLVMHDAGGAVALWAPTGLAFNAEGVILGRDFLRLTLDHSGQTLGEAVGQTLGAYLTAGEPDLYIPYIYTLIGDPAIRLGSGE